MNPTKRRLPLTVREAANFEVFLRQHYEMHYEKYLQLAEDGYKFLHSFARQDAVIDVDPDLLVRVIALGLQGMDEDFEAKLEDCPQEQVFDKCTEFAKVIVFGHMCQLRRP